MRPGRRLAAVAVAATLAAAALPWLAAPALATNVANDAQFRAAWGDPAETLITLTASITLDCVSSPLRNSPNAVVVEGAGFTLDNPCPGLTALVSSGAGSVTVRNLTVTGDSATAGGIEAGSDLVIESSTITGHGGHGVELGTDGADLTLTSSTVSNNGLADSGDGDGINMRIATATITGSTITGNLEDGIESEGAITVTNSTISNQVNENGIRAEGNVTVTGSTISGNGVGQGSCGDGIEVERAGTVTVTNSTISGNADVGVLADGHISVTGSTVSGNGVIGECDEDGIRAGGPQAAEANVTVTRSTVSNNGDSNGNGVIATGDATVTDSTITGNSADGVNADNATVTNSTITDNTDAGINAGEEVNVRHGTLSGNGDNIVNVQITTIHIFGTVLIDPDRLNCVGAVDDDGFNFVDDASCVGIAANAADPQLGALANNGGPAAPVNPTFTRLPADTSPLVDAIPLVSCTTLTTDQRGMPRPVGSGCDIGAVEVQQPAASINDVTVTEGNSGTVNAVFTVTLSRASTKIVTMSYATANGTAIAPSDYESVSGTVTFAVGDTSETITVRVVGDTIDEPNETFLVNLTAPTGGTLADAQGIGTIIDDEGPIVTPTPTGGQLPDTATGEATVGGSGTFGALALLMLLGSALVWTRRRQPIRRRWAEF